MSDPDNLPAATTPNKDGCLPSVEAGSTQQAAWEQRSSQEHGKHQLSNKHLHLSQNLFIKDLDMADKMTRTVTAPYIRASKRPTGHVCIGDKAWRSLVSGVKGKRKTEALTRHLAGYLNDTVDIAVLLHETADVLQLVTKSDGVTLYITDNESGQIFNEPKSLLSARPRSVWKIGVDSTVSAHVAFHREYQVVEDLPNDQRFPLGLGWLDEDVRCVLCVPVVTPEEEIIALIELFKNNKSHVRTGPYQRVDLEIVVTVTGWMGAAIHQNQQRRSLTLSQELNDSLLEMTRRYFSDQVDIVRMISTIVKHAKTLIGAERGSFFIVDQSSGKPMADHYEECIDSTYSSDGLLLLKKKKVDFRHYLGVATTVMQSGVVANIQDASTDPRYSGETDRILGRVSKTILCTPFKGSKGVIGMIKLVNKKLAPAFTDVDATILHSYAVYCTLSLNYFSMQRAAKNAQLMDVVESEMLQVHCRACVHDRTRMMQAPMMAELPPNFSMFAFYPTGFEEQMPQMIYFMITDTSPGTFDERVLVSFILTVKKGYRKNPYHNFDHAFNVAHCMYNVLKRNKDIFTALEKKALVIAAYCHDIDHRGFTNNFMQQINAELIQLYPESCMENHHFQTTMRIIQVTKVFGKVSAAEYKDIVDEIHDAIIATDLALYFRCRPRLIVILGNNEFDWAISNHRVLVKSIIMTTCDLSGQAKPFPVAKKITESLYREFYHQGDLEKEMGLVPLSMMDREKQHTIPMDQKRFIEIVVLPCVELLYKIFPNTAELFNLCW